MVLIGLALAGNDADSTSDSAAIAFGGVSAVIAIASPWIVWAYFGFRAMKDLEEATTHQHPRRHDRNAEAAVGDAIGSTTSQMAPGLAGSSIDLHDLR